MMFSKSFGYSVRGMLYIALMQDEKVRVHAEEVAGELGVPKPYMSKILKTMVKEGLLLSVKGPQGGFGASQRTLETTLMDIFKLTDGLGYFNRCALRMDECSSKNPCPMHVHFEQVKSSLRHRLETTTIGQLITGNKAEFIRSIASLNFEVGGVLV
ncbi:Rrf2 family transcriptional regulator [Paraflavisolibacter sp. H34]|uniref:RrF2 family transcriptional regulator n=1 Tax=Huijunlia imazamoxiresistens TaxID=3127457 RepID=UPI003017A5D4